MSAPLYFAARLTRALLGPRGPLDAAIVARYGLAATLADCQRLDDLASCELAAAGPGGRGPTVSRWAERAQAP